MCFLPLSQGKPRTILEPVAPHLTTVLLAALRMHCDMDCPLSAMCLRMSSSDSSLPNETKIKLSFPRIVEYSGTEFPKTKTLGLSCNCSMDLASRPQNSWEESPSDHHAGAQTSTEKQGHHLTLYVRYSYPACPR